LVVEGFKRRLSAILSADVKGYSRLMSDDEEHTVSLITAYRQFIAELISKHRGKVVDSPGDNILAEFGSALNAVLSAVEIQSDLKKRNDDLPENRRMIFRIGINLGEVIVKGDRIYGDGVNIAARIEGVADPGGVCISRSIYEQIKNKIDQGFEYLGEQAAKNIADPIQIYRVLIDSVNKVPTLSKKLRLPDKPSTVVLPFENMSADSEQDFFCDGITEEIITGLATVPQLFVIARNSSFAFKGKHVKVQQVSKEFGVKYVLEGSVRKSSNRVRITAQLIDAIAGNHLWAERYDRELGDIFALQDEITMKIVTALQVKLTVGEQARLWARRTDNLDAYLKYLTARSRFAHGKIDNYSLVRRIAEESITLDKEYSVPYVLIAWTHYYDAKQGSSESRGKSFEKAKLLAQKAQELDDLYPDTHILMGFIHLYQKQFQEALIAGKKAIALGPNNAEAHVIMAHILRFTGKFEEATTMIQKALRLQPYYPSFYLTELGMCFYYTCRYREAVEMAKEFLNMAENQGDLELLYFGHALLAMSYTRMGLDEDARLAASRVLHYFPKYSLEWDRKASFYQDPDHLKQQHDDLRQAGIT
jgi:adenylate cyclase